MTPKTLAFGADVVKWGKILISKIRSLCQINLGRSWAWKSKQEGDYF